MQQQQYLFQTEKVGKIKKKSSMQTISFCHRVSLFSWPNKHGVILILHSKFTKETTQQVDVQLEKHSSPFCSLHHSE